MSRRRGVNAQIFKYLYPPTMLLKSKATSSHIQNLSKSSKHSQKPHIEDVEDEEASVLTCHSSDNCNSERLIGLHKSVINPDLIEIFNWFEELEEDGLSDLDEDSDDEDNLDGQGVRNDDMEIREISKLEAFVKALQKAQAVVVESEQEREKGNKWPKQYLGNSDRTKQRCLQNMCVLNKKGYVLIDRWFGKGKSNPANLKVLNKPEYISIDDLESEPEMIPSLPRGVSMLFKEMVSTMNLKD